MSHKEINKFLKKLSAEKLRNNHKECIELYNIIGGLYSEIGSYDEAVHYHEQALELCKTIGDRLNTALAFRYIGEAKAALGDFVQGISHIKRYLDLVQKIDNKVEIQRAWTTLGRIYLMQAQEMKDKLAEGAEATDRGLKEVAREAERRFLTALNLAESVRDQVDVREYAQMNSGLLMNLGLINDICGQHKESVIKFKRAIELCRASKLKEDLFRCQIVLAGMFRQKDNIKEAVKTSEEALQTARSIGKKILICEALIERGLTRICQRDFKNAKRTFAQAYLEKSPSEDDHIKAIRLTKLTHLIATAHEKICINTSASEDRLKICDKLGDLFVAIGNCKLAIEFYRQAFTDAKACSKPKKDQARILYSLAETYADVGLYTHALACYEKELSFRGDNRTEQCQSMIKIAHMLEYLDKDSKEVCEQYQKALETAGEDPKLMYSVLRYYVPYLKANSNDCERYEELETLLTKVQSYPEVEDEIEEEGNEEANDLDDEIANIEDIITDDEDDDEVLMVGRRRAKGKSKFKQNEVGDTPLHEACIKGDFKRVKSLISQGHEVNPRDNAGWIPLHEACNHGHYQIAEHLIENGADVNNRGVKGLSPLHDAASNGHFDIMRLLIKSGANAISLTDSGETVLSCLRDYKNRCYKEMSNSELIEYRQMEAELLNVMDKCGFNLMSENIKTLGSRGSAGPSGLKSATHSAPVAKARPKTTTSSTVLSNRDVDIQKNARPSPLSTSVASKSSSSSNVKEYRDAMVTMKRKRPLEVSQPSKKASQPATFQTNTNTSISTKQWLLNDDEDIIEEIDEEDDEEPEFLIETTKSLSSTTTRPAKTSKRRRSNDNGAQARRIISDDEDDDILFLNEDGQLFKRNNEIGNKSDLNVTSQLEPADEDMDLPPMSPDLNPRNSLDTNGSVRSLRSPINSDNHSHNQGIFSFGSNSNFSSVTTSNNTNATFDLFNKPLLVTIEDRKLMIPLKDELSTIGDLKKLIVDRYSILVNAKPKISLAPKSDINCLLFDDDLCKDVVNESLVASIESWQLKSIEDTYLDECVRQHIEPLDFIKIELKGLDETGAKLNLAYMKFPQAHKAAILNSLKRRDFIQANFQGAVSLFEQNQQQQQQQQTSAAVANIRSRDIFETIITWKNLTRLNLKGTGLLKTHFEYLCGMKTRLPELQCIDLSFNSIVYKQKREFTAQVQQLRLACPKLRQLDVRRNHLQFVRTILATLSKQQNTTTDSNSDLEAASQGDNITEYKSISKELGLSDIELLAQDQCDYIIYSSSV